MIPDSTNVRVMADNIRKLKTEVENAVELPTVETTDEGKVLTVNSSGKWAALDLPGSIPKDYSITEQDTGVKWINGKTIYSKVYSGNIPAIASNTNITLDTEDLELIYTHGTVKTSAGAEYDIPFYSTSALTAYVSNDSTNHLYVRVGTTFSEGSYSIIAYYTKPDPEPEPGPEEPETKKSTKRKTTKGEN